jgi:hypothetical protein
MASTPPHNHYVALFKVTFQLSIDKIINYGSVLVMNLIECRRGGGVQSSFDDDACWGSKEITKTEEHALALRHPKVYGTKQNQ